VWSCITPILGESLAIPQKVNTRPAGWCSSIPSQSQELYTENLAGSSEKLSCMSWKIKTYMTGIEPKTFPQQATWQKNCKYKSTRN
jgi:hypothetical protein